MIERSRSCVSKKSVMAVEAAFGVQEEPMIPVTPDDEPLDAIVTETPVVIAARGG